MGDTYTVERSVHVEAPAERVYDHVVDFHRWPRWSPWEDVDPGQQRTYSGPGSGVGATYAWEGNRKAGKGTMEIVEAQPSSLVRIDLTFEKPFKARNDTVFTIEPDGDGSRVTWTMTGRKSLMTKVMGVVMSMDKLLGRDFEKGLARLRSVAEEPRSPGGPSPSDQSPGSGDPRPGDHPAG